jgi:hypothetical protein
MGEATSYIVDKIVSLAMVGDVNRMEAHGGTPRVIHAMIETAGIDLADCTLVIGATTMPELADALRGMVPDRHEILMDRIEYLRSTPSTLPIVVTALYRRTVLTSVLAIGTSGVMASA